MHDFLLRTPASPTPQRCDAVKPLNSLAARLPTRARRVVSWADLARGAGVVPTVRQYHATNNRLAVPEFVSRILKQIWSEASAEIGAECVPLGRGFFEIRCGESMTRVRHSMTMLDDAVTLDLAGDKEISQRLMADRGLAVPENVTLANADLAPVLDLLRRSPAGCVVKPSAASSGGRGVTCGVRTPAELALAVRRASGFGYPVLVEPMVSGDNYRLLFLDGELLDVIRRDRPTVTGDGRSSVGELIVHENRRRLAARGEAGLWLVRLDLDCLFTLKQAGLTLRSVPAAQARVTVKTVANDNGAHENLTVTSRISPDLMAEAAAAATTLGVRLAGVDLITTDLSRPLAEVGGAINEVNTTPGLMHHYMVADRAGATRVAVPILRTLLGAEVRESSAISAA